MTSTLAISIVACVAILVILQIPTLLTYTVDLKAVSVGEIGVPKNNDTNGARKTTGIEALANGGVNAPQASHEDTEFRLAIVVPGLGDVTRISILNQSLQAIMSSPKTPTSCTVYVYNQTLFDEHRQDLPQCELIFNKGFWTHHMDRAPLHPMVNGENATHVALLLDDLHLSFDLQIHRVLKLMARANYQAATASVPMWLHEVMRPRPKCLSHLSNFADVLFTIMTLDAWVCWKYNVKRYLHLEFGWGLDLIFADSCHIRIGVLDDVQAHHDESCWVPTKSKTGKVVKVYNPSKCSRSYGTKGAREQMFELIGSHLGSKKQADAKAYKQLVHKTRHAVYPYCHLYRNGTEEDFV